MHLFSYDYYKHRDGIAKSPQAKQGTGSQLYLELSGHLAIDKTQTQESIACSRSYERHHNISWKCHVKTCPAPMQLSQAYRYYIQKDSLFNDFSLHTDAD